MALSWTQQQQLHNSLTLLLLAQPLQIRARLPLWPVLLTPVHCSSALLLARQTQRMTNTQQVRCLQRVLTSCSRAVLACLVAARNLPCSGAPQTTCWLSSACLCFAQDLGFSTLACRPAVKHQDTSCSKIAFSLQPCCGSAAAAADCEAVADLLCQTWLRELLTTGRSSSSTTQPDLLLHLGEQQQQQVLRCNLQQHLLQLDPWLLPAHLCPCHGLPMHPPSNTSSSSSGSGRNASTAGAAAAAVLSGSDIDAATAAGLLLLPEQVPWSCRITGQPVLQDLNSCVTDSNVLQLGRHTQLRAGPSSQISGQQQQQTRSGGAVASSSSKPVAAALALPVGQPCEMTVRHVVGLHEVDSMMLYGMPLVVAPAVNVTTAAAAAAGPDSSSSDDASMLMRAVCQLLIEHGQVLLACGSHDLHRRCSTPLLHWYMLQPAGDGCSLLLRCLASREQLLPPKGFAGVMQQQMEGEADEEGEQVVLLDAEQLEAVRGSLAGLGLGENRDDIGSSGEFGGSGAVEGQLQPASAAAGAGVAAVDILTADAAAGNGASAEAAALAQQQLPSAAGADAPPTTSGNSSRALPLLLSCGLHEWVAAVLDSSAGTYTTPAVLPPAPGAASLPPTAPQQPPFGMQQQQHRGPTGVQQQQQGSVEQEGGNGVHAYAKDAPAAQHAAATDLQQQQQQGRGSRRRGSANQAVQQAGNAQQQQQGTRAGGRAALRLSSSNKR
jgi:hypothetical protein